MQPLPVGQDLVLEIRAHRALDALGGPLAGVSIGRAQLRRLEHVVQRRPALRRRAVQVQQRVHEDAQHARRRLGGTRHDVGHVRFRSTQKVVAVVPLLGVRVVSGAIRRGAVDFANELIAHTQPRDARDVFVICTADRRAARRAARELHGARAIAHRVRVPVRTLVPPYIVRGGQDHGELVARHRGHVHRAQGRGRKEYRRPEAGRIVRSDAGDKVHA